MVNVLDYCGEITLNRKTNDHMIMFRSSVGVFDLKEKPGANTLFCFWRK